MHHDQLDLNGIYRQSYDIDDFVSELIELGFSEDEATEIYHELDYKYSN